MIQESREGHEEQGRAMEGDAVQVWREADHWEQG